MSASGTSRRLSAEPAGRSNPRPAPPQFQGKYLSLTTFKRDATGVATTVWFVTEAGKILIVTDSEAYKVRQRCMLGLACPAGWCSRWGRARRVYPGSGRNTCTSTRTARIAEITSRQ
jgi:hypothetical protein